MRKTRFSSNHSTRRDVLNKEVADKETTAKEEARELQLKEDSCIREKVMSLQNVSVLLRALGEMAIANPVFTNRVCQSSIVVPNCWRDYRDAVKLSKCTVDPLCNWCIELIATVEASVLWGYFPSSFSGRIVESHHWFILNVLFSSNHSTRRDVLNKEVTGAPRKDVKKAGDKATTTKEQARELQLKEESCIREKVMSIQNISVLLRALGEMAIANPVFTNSQLPSVQKEAGISIRESWYD